MVTACTIVDKKYLPYAEVLFASLKKFIPNFPCKAVVVDASTSDSLSSYANFETIPIETIFHNPTAVKIFNKYAHTNTDHLRWALKPVVLLHLLDQNEKVIFLDPDVYFVGDPSFLLTQLNSCSALLAPHWSEIDPLKYEDGLFSVMRNGLYSGGFIGVSHKARPALEWWAGACHYKMDASPSLGVFVDQKYLDLFPLILEDADVIRHPGCNLTNINMLSFVRSNVDGQVRINQTFEPIFIHFTRDTMYNIEKGNDPHLSGYLELYKEELKKSGAEIKTKPVAFYEPIKSSLRLRTRIRKLFFRLSQKI